MQIVQKAGLQSGAAPFTFVLSTGEVDRVGDVVVQSGISLTAFRQNPVALFAHNSRQPIGVWENIRREGDNLLADLKLAARGTSRMIDELRSLVEQKILRAASVGLGIVKAEPLDPERPFAGVRYSKTELLEASLVAVPANASALALRSLSAETKAFLFPEGEQGTTPSDPLAHAATASAANVLNKGRPMNIAERIKAARARLGEVEKQLQQMKAAAEADNAADVDGETLATLADEQSTLEKNIANLEKLETAIGATAEPAIANTPALIHRRNRSESDEPKGTLLARMALAHVYAHVERRGVVDVVRDHFKSDARLEPLLKTAVGVADTTTVGWAKELVQNDVQGFIEGLAPTSAYAALASRGFVVNFGSAGSISVPSRMTGGTDMAGAFVGENGVIPVKRTTITAAVLNRYKMAVITTLTKELSRVSTPQAETLLRGFIATDTGIALDHAFISAAPGVPGTRPPGILNGVAPIAASAAATPVEKAIQDLKALVNALVTNNAGVRPVFIMNPAQKLSLSLMYSAGVFMFRDEIVNGRLMGLEVVTSLNVDAGDVILVDAAALASGLGTPEFDVSDTATLVMANSDTTAPTHATDPADRTLIGTKDNVPPDGGLSAFDPAQRAAGKAGEGVATISLFQQWAIGIRMVLPLSWAMVRPGAVAWVDNVGW